MRAQLALEPDKAPSTSCKVRELAKAPEVPMLRAQLALEPDKAPSTSCEVAKVVVMPMLSAQ